MSLRMSTPRTVNGREKAEGAMEAAQAAPFVPSGSEVRGELRTTRSFGSAA